MLGGAEAALLVRGARCISLRTTTERRPKETMSIYYELVNDTSKKRLTLGTGLWHVILCPNDTEDAYDRIPARSAGEVLELLRANHLVASWGDTVLKRWAGIIATFMNGQDTRIVHDSPDPDDPEDDSVEYEWVGYLKEMHSSDDFVGVKTPRT